jgi:hypothetical protein
VFYNIFSDRCYTTDLIWYFSADPVTSHIMKFLGIRTNIPCRQVNIEYIASRFRLFKSVAITHLLSRKEYSITIIITLFLSSPSFLTSSRSCNGHAPLIIQEGHARARQRVQSQSSSFASLQHIFAPRKVYLQRF